ncbi:MAG: putative quorum-sensing-regulated virulence factor [Planctomycetaceae bacterium]
MILPFGKHAGKPLCDVPRSYLRWLNTQDWFHDEYRWDLAAEVRRLLGTTANTETQPPSTVIVTDTLKTWRRAVLAKWHPDRAGGSHSAFLAASDAVESLTKLLAERGVSA